MNTSSHSTTSLSGATGSLTSSKTTGSIDAKFVSFAFVPPKSNDTGSRLFTPRDVIISPSTGRVAGDVTHVGAAARRERSTSRPAHHTSVLQTSVGSSRGSDVTWSEPRRRSDVSFGRVSLTSSQAESAHTLTPLSGSLRLSESRVSFGTPRVEGRRKVRTSRVTSPRRSVQ